jgi:dTDP-4-amino-4,6-dideoxygalactose transaminase
LPLKEKYSFRLPEIAENATNNGHMFYLVTEQIEEREALIAHLKQKEIHAVFHYLSLHKSPFYEAKHDGRILSNSDFFADGLLRLPMYFELTMEQVDYIVSELKIFYNRQ